MSDTPQPRSSSFSESLRCRSAHTTGLDKPDEDDVEAVIRLDPPLQVDRYTTISALCTWIDGDETITQLTVTTPLCGDTNTPPRMVTDDLMPEELDLDGADPELVDTLRDLIDTMEDQINHT